MSAPLAIIYRNVKKSAAIDQLIQKKYSKLINTYNRISSCRVAVEKPQEHQQRGNPYRVRLLLSVPPGHELVITRDVGEGEMHEALVTVIRKVFESAGRRLKKHKEKQRGFVKMPEQ